jgi:hypothetical protein
MNTNTVSAECLHRWCRDCTFEDCACSCHHHVRIETAIRKALAPEAKAAEEFWIRENARTEKPAETDEAD